MRQVLQRIRTSRPNGRRSTNNSGSVATSGAYGNDYNSGATSNNVVEGTWCYFAPESLLELGTRPLPRGTSPSGCMKVSLVQSKCAGYSCNTIQIDYVMEAGIQMDYHPSPDTAYPSTARTAYLPNDKDGRELLRRLQFAFLHGLTFRVGSSISDGKSNVITWSSLIQHKTSLVAASGNKAVHGYPDMNYINNCSSQLDQVGVPRADIMGPLPRPLEGTWNYSAPSTLKTEFDSCIERSIVPYQAAVGVKEECSICLTNLFAFDVVQLKACQHFFHEKCLRDALKHQPNCPMCRNCVTEHPQGKSPSGTMVVSIVPNSCFGYQCCNTIQIDYSIKHGVQTEYHPSPGTPYRSTKRRAFVPNNSDGRKLLQRLKYAFMHGLTFTVGTSLTTGTRNVVTWSSVHHKTSVNGGPYGYPDPSYFDNCNSELDSIGVPQAESIDGFFTPLLCTEVTVY